MGDVHLYYKGGDACAVKQHMGGVLGQALVLAAFAGTGKSQCFVTRKHPDQAKTEWKKRCLFKLKHHMLMVKGSCCEPQVKFKWDFLWKFFRIGHCE